MVHRRTHRAARLAICLLGCLALAAGCAKGSDDEPVLDDGTDAAPREDTSVPMSPGAGDGGGRDGEGRIDASTDGQTDQDASGIACDTPKPCASGQDLGEVKGDRGTDTRDATGSTSQWLKVLVRQPSTGPWGDSAVTVTLESPAGANFDLYASLGPLNEGPAKCAGSPDGTSTSTSATDSVHLAWPETFSDDTRWLTIEVRHVSGTCLPSATWKLSVKGNQ